MSEKVVIDENFVSRTLIGKEIKKGDQLGKRRKI